MFSKNTKKKENYNLQSKVRLMI